MKPSLWKNTAPVFEQSGMKKVKILIFWSTLHYQGVKMLTYDIRKFKKSVFYGR